jgi:26S proteasome regulatory subunit N2
LDDGDAMQVEDGDAKKEGAKEGGEETKDEDAMQVEDEEEEKKPKKKREPEPSSFRIPNPARMTQAQIALCELDLEQRYRPIRPNQKMLGGVLMLTDSRPEEPEEELAAVRSPTDEPEGELPPPEPFVWTVPPLPEVKEESKEAESKSSEE